MRSLAWRHAGLLNGPGPAGESLLDRAVATFERNFIVRSLDKAEWNVTATARTLDIPLSTLKSKMKRLGIREIARRIRGD